MKEIITYKILISFQNYCDEIVLSVQPKPCVKRFKYFTKIILAQHIVRYSTEINIRSLRTSLKLFSFRFSRFKPISLQYHSHTLCLYDVS